MLCTTNGSPIVFMRSRMPQIWLRSPIAIRPTISLLWLPTSKIYFCNPVAFIYSREGSNNHGSWQYHHHSVPPRPCSAIDACASVSNHNVNTKVAEHTSIEYGIFRFFLSVDSPSFSGPLGARSSHFSLSILTWTLVPASNHSSVPPSTCQTQAFSSSLLAR